MITDSKFQHSGPSLPAVKDQRQLHPACSMGRRAGLPAWPPPAVCPTQWPSRGRGDGGLCGRGTGKEVSANGKKVPGSLSIPYFSIDLHTLYTLYKISCEYKELYFH